MRMSTLAARAKALVDKRGGPESVKRDAGELRDIARGSGTLGDKAKRAAAALRQPGADPGAGARSVRRPPSK